MTSLVVARWSCIILGNMYFIAGRPIFGMVWIAMAAIALILEITDKD